MAIPEPRAAGELRPTMSRRHAAGAESARGLLFTILGELVLPTGAPTWTSAFIEVMGRLGVEEKASRQALMRTAADGWLRPQRMGRRTRWHLTSSAERLLSEGADRIYGFTGRAQRWDGRWLLVVARAPETDRPARHLLRSRLTGAGFGSPTPGVWISTHTDRIGEVEDVLRQAGVFPSAQIFLAEHRGLTDLAAMVDRAWDLDAIDGDYRQFLEEFTDSPTDEPLARLIELVHAWRRFPWTDPGLPAQFLPPSWVGQEAAWLFERRHGDWAGEARAEWRRVSPPAG